MCGFTGIIDLNGIDYTNELKNSMSLALKRLYPRGPDQNDYFIDEHAYLVHARLSIIDITDNGKQPILSLIHI